MASASTVDPDALKRFQFRLFSHLQGALTSAMVNLGDRLGLYGALAESDRPVTSAELAERAGLHERWVREWAYQQGAAGLVDVDRATELISLTPEAAAVLATPEHEAFGLGEFVHLPHQMGALGRLADSFRTGVGHEYDAQGVDGAIGGERSFEPWNSHHLVTDVLPAATDAHAALGRGIAAADVGCGAGGAVLMMARAFPNSRFTGYDISQFALGRARERLADSGLNNAEFADARESPLPADGSLGFVTMFDCLHDMAHPQEMATAVRASLADDGTWMLVDIKAFDSYGENAEHNPMAALMYGFSVVSCLSSGLSQPGGAGLGTLGLTESKAHEIATTAGFTRVRRLDIAHPIDAFYEIRP